jgi:hypothetical protein
MSTPLHVDVAAVDRTQFKVFEEDGETLVIPRKDKFRWDEGELHLRSLVLDASGREAQLVVDAAALGEHAPTLQAWRRDPDGEIRATLTRPVREDDG